MTTSEPPQDGQPYHADPSAQGQPYQPDAPVQDLPYQPYPEPPVQDVPYQPEPPFQGQPYYPEPPGQPYPAQSYPAAPYPPQQYPPQPYPYAYPYPPARPTNGMAVAAMVLGILWVYWVGSILALVFGYLARAEIRRTGQAGEGMAIAGIVLGWVGIGVLCIVLMFGIIGVATR